MTAAPPEHRSTPRRFIACVLALWTLAVLVRLPALVNARGIDSDTGVVALQAEHLLHGEWSWNVWGAPYQGSLDAIALAGAMAVFGRGALVLMLVPLIQHLLCIALTFDVLRRRLDNQLKALIGAAVLVATPLAVNSVVLYLPRQGSITLIFLAVWLLDRSDQRGWLAILACVFAGVAAWADQITLIFFPGLALMALIRGRYWQSVVGFALGMIPLLITWSYAGSAVRKLSVTPAKIGYNVQLLTDQALPLLLGYKTFARPIDYITPAIVTPRIEFLIPLTLIGLSLLGLIAFSAIRALRECDRAAGSLTTFGVVTVALTLCAYCVSSQPQDVFSARYLAPVIWSAPFALVVVVRHLSSRTLCMLLAPYLLLQCCAGWLAFTHRGYVDGPVIVRSRAGQAVEERALAEFLRSHGVDEAMAQYWIAYRLSYLWDEDPICVPLDPSQDRYTPQRDRVRTAERIALIFHAEEPRAQADDTARQLVKRHVEFERHQIAGFDVVIVPNTANLP